MNGLLLSRIITLTEYLSSTTGISPINLPNCAVETAEFKGQISVLLHLIYTFGGIGKDMSSLSRAFSCALFFLFFLFAARRFLVDACGSKDQRRSSLGRGICHAT